MGAEPGNDERVSARRGSQIRMRALAVHCRSTRWPVWGCKATRCSVLVGLGVALGLAQPISHVPLSDACIGLNDDVLVQAANGQIEKVESAISRALASGATQPLPCSPPGDRGLSKLQRW
jgi:hypothetical protein